MSGASGTLCKNRERGKPNMREPSRNSTALTIEFRSLTSRLPSVQAYGTEYIWTEGNRDVNDRNSIVSAVELRDGSRMFGFPRSRFLHNVPDAPDISKLRGLNLRTNGADSHLQVWAPQALNYQLGEDILRLLVEDEAECVFAQHLGALAP